MPRIAALQGASNDGRGIRALRSDDVPFSTKKDRDGSEGALGQVESRKTEKGCMVADDGSIANGDPVE